MCERVGHHTLATHAGPEKPGLQAQVPEATEHTPAPPQSAAQPRGTSRPVAALLPAAASSLPVHSAAAQTVT
jgi:hypothetical protein